MRFVGHFRVVRVMRMRIPKVEAKMCQDYKAYKGYKACLTGGNGGRPMVRHTAQMGLYTWRSNKLARSGVPREEIRVDKLTT
jgi:hypothetical protein